jgi:hypothetical protein
MGMTNDIGGGIKAASQFTAGRDRDYLEKANESIAQTQAKSEFSAAAYNTNIARMRARSIMGTQVANTGANNLQQGGTPSEVIASTAKTQEANALQIQNNAMRRAWGFEVEGSSDQYQGDQAERGGILSGLGTLASTAGGSYKSYSFANPGT